MMTMMMMMMMMLMMTMMMLIWLCYELRGRLKWEALKHCVTPWST